MITIVGSVGSTITLPIAREGRVGLRAKTVERLRRALSYPNPEYVRALRMNRHASNVDDRVYCMHETPGGQVRVPRGAIREVRRALAEDETRVEFIDERVRGESLDVELRNVELRDYQREGTREIKRLTQGLIVLPCGAGKTTLGVGSIARIKRSTLIIAHTDDLLDQWIDDIEERLDFSPGRVRAGVEIVRPITVASVWMLDRMLAEPWPRRDQAGSLWSLSDFGFVIVDECHHAPAATFTRVLRHIAARYRLGLTATPDREDGQTKLVAWSFGDTILERTVPDLVARGWLTPPEVHAIESDFEFSYDGLERKRIEAMTRALIRDEDRNALIVRAVHREFERGESVLVLSNRKAHCQKLARLLADRGIEAPVLTSKTAKGERKQVLEDMRSGARSIMIATSLADEGLDIRRLSRIVLALPERAEGRTVQRVGRLMRPFKGKNPILIDIVDRKVDTLLSRWKDRSRAYRKRLGLEVKEAA